MNKPYIPSKAKTLGKNLPPPNWSPTGESGYWVWRDDSWKWLTDEEYKELKAEEK